jgi:hypothetical protein
MKAISTQPSAFSPGAAWPSELFFNLDCLAISAILAILFPPLPPFLPASKVSLGHAILVKDFNAEC